MSAHYPRMAEYQLEQTHGFGFQDEPVLVNNDPVRLGRLVRVSRGYDQQMSLAANDPHDLNRHIAQSLINGIRRINPFTKSTGCEDGSDVRRYIPGNLMTTVETAAADDDSVAKLLLAPGIFYFSRTDLREESIFDAINILTGSLNLTNIQNALTDLKEYLFRKKGQPMADALKSLNITTDDIFEAPVNIVKFQAIDKLKATLQPEDRKQALQGLADVGLSALKASVSRHCLALKPYFNQEGIFRQSPVDKNKRKDPLVFCNDRPSEQLSDYRDIFALSLKELFGKLAERGFPVISQRMALKILSCHSEDELEEVFHQLKDSLDISDAVYRQLFLGDLADFLREVATTALKEDLGSRMDATDLATIFGPRFMETKLDGHKLHTSARLPNPRRVEVFLKEKNIVVDSVAVDVMKGEHKTNDFTGNNMDGRIPVLTNDLAQMTNQAKKNNAVTKIVFLMNGVPLKDGTKPDQATLSKMAFEMVCKLNDTTPEAEERLLRIRKNLNRFNGDHFRKADIGRVLSRKCRPIGSLANITGSEPRNGLGSTWRTEPNLTESVPQRTSAVANNNGVYVHYY